jgi:hypothetical protein
VPQRVPKFEFLKAIEASTVYVVPEKINELKAKINMSIDKQNHAEK